MVEIIIPDNLTNWYAGGIVYESSRKLLAVVVDWDNYRSPCPKPFGGKGEAWDESPMATARREGREEINFDLPEPGEPISYRWRGDHGSCLFLWRMGAEEFDNQLVYSRREHELGGRSKIVHVMHVQQVLAAGEKEFVPYYKTALEPTLFRLMSE